MGGWDSGRDRHAHRSRRRPSVELATLKGPRPSRVQTSPSPLNSSRVEACCTWARLMEADEKAEQAAAQAAAERVESKLKEQPRMDRAGQWFLRGLRIKTPDRRHWPRSDQTKGPEFGSLGVLPCPAVVTLRWTPPSGWRATLPRTTCTGLCELGQKLDGPAFPAQLVASRDRSGAAKFGGCGLDGCGKRNARSFEPPRNK